MNTIPNSNFIFSARFRVLRHVAFWIAHCLFIVFIYSTTFPVWRNLAHDLIWLPVYLLYSYPLRYWAIPKYLLKNKFLIFTLIIIIWIIGGWYINVYYRTFFFIPVQEYLKFSPIVRGAQPGSFMVMVITAAAVSLIGLFKYWALKQQQWIQAEREKATAELQLLKAQVHPHFLFNTLNNIYSFSLENSPKTPGLILKLSSLLSYMLYDCKADEVLLEKETGIMKDYIDLEKERYGNRIEISWTVEGDIKEQLIAPLLMLPFLENAFKHGTSEQLDKPWLNVDIAVKQNILRCKIANSKNEFVTNGSNGIGIPNVKKRLRFLYPEKHELKMNDEGNFFVVSLLIHLKNEKTADIVSRFFSPLIENVAS